MCLSECGFVHPQRSKQGINSLELEQPMAVSCLMWVQGVDLESFARAVYAVLLITEPSLQPREFFFLDMVLYWLFGNFTSCTPLLSSQFFHICAAPLQQAPKLIKNKTYKHSLCSPFSPSFWPVAVAFR